MPPEVQQVLLNKWATGTDFVCDTGKQPKAEFARLAKIRGWVGGDIYWNIYWKACFGEEYTYGAFRPTTNSTTDNMAATVTTNNNDSGSYLPDRMRRSSVSSDESFSSISFSLIDSNPSIRSLDTNGSVAGGVAIGAANVDVEGLEARIEAVTLTDNVTNDNHTVPPKIVKTKIRGKSKPKKSESTPPPPKVSSFWFEFPGFVPNPTARFKAEFSRLAAHERWGENKRNHLLKALNAEVATFYGTCVTRLNHWQQLCEDVGIDPIPSSITQCRKALAPPAVYVNLFNLIDHCRNPEYKVRRFGSYKEFREYTSNGRTFPRAVAKQDGVIKVLLKKM